MPTSDLLRKLSPRHGSPVNHFHIGNRVSVSMLCKQRPQRGYKETLQWCLQNPFQTNFIKGVGGEQEQNRSQMPGVEGVEEKVLYNQLTHN